MAFTSGRAASFYNLPKNLDDMIVLKPIAPVVTEKGYSLKIADEIYPVFRPTVPVIYESVKSAIAELREKALR